MRTILASHRAEIHRIADQLEVDLLVLSELVDYAAAEFAHPGHLRTLDSIERTTDALVAAIIDTAGDQD